MFRGLRSWVFVAFALLAGLAAAAAQQPAAPSQTPSTRGPLRLALVVGNAIYPAGPLPTAANDAGLMAETLALAGFDVTAAADADTTTLQKLVQRFVAKATAAANPDLILVVYLSGYGMQVDGDNYFVPVDAKIAHDVDVSGAALRLSELAHALDALPAKARFYVYDLARETPFAKTGAPLATGLALPVAAPNTLVAFNTAPGTVATTDGATQGIYARALSAMIRMPGLPAGDLFERLRLRVAQTTNGTSVPWDDSQVDPALMLAPAMTASVAPAARPANPPLGSLAPDAAFFATLARDQLADYVTYVSAFKGEPLVGRVRTLAAARREASIWAASVMANSAAAYWTYMRRYPRGPHLFDARRKLALLHAQLEPPPRFDLWDFGALGKPSPDEIAILARRPLTLEDPDEPPLPPPPEGLIPPLPADVIDLSVPPLAVSGALPMPMPLRIGAAGPAGVVRQPFVVGAGELLTQFRTADGGAPEIVTTQAGAIVSRTQADSIPGKRIVSQRDAQGAIISRSVTTTAGDTVTTIQTGPTGGILKKIVTRSDASGARTTSVSNGANQLITSVDRDKNGVVLETQRGTPAPRAETLVVKHPRDARGPPKVEPAASALAAPKAAPVRPPVASHVEPANPTPAVRPNPPVPAVGPTTNPTQPKAMKVDAAPPPPAAGPALPAATQSALTAMPKPVPPVAGPPLAPPNLSPVPLPPRRPAALPGASKRNAKSGTAASRHAGPKRPRGSPPKRRR